MIPVYAAGEEDGRLYLAMRYVEGTDLHRLLREEGALAPPGRRDSWPRWLRRSTPRTRAGLVHRDVKPANVLLAGEHAYLTDFGLTRLAGSDTQLTETGTGSARSTSARRSSCAASAATRAPTSTRSAACCSPR